MYIKEAKKKKSNGYNKGQTEEDTNMSRYFATVLTHKSLSTGYNVYNWHIIVTMKKDTSQVTIVRKAGFHLNQ